MGISDIFPLPSALGLFCAVFRTFAEGFSLNIATFFSAIAINLRIISYLCTQKRAKLGGASAIGARSIAFGLHELCA